MLYYRIQDPIGFNAIQYNGMWHWKRPPPVNLLVGCFISLPPPSSLRLWFTKWMPYLPLPLNAVIFYVPGGVLSSGLFIFCFSVLFWQLLYVGCTFMPGNSWWSLRPKVLNLVHFLLISSLPPFSLSGNYQFNTGKVNLNCWLIRLHLWLCFLLLTAAGDVYFALSFFAVLIPWCLF